MLDPDSRILVVDDAEITRKVLLAMLSKLGFHNLTTVANARTAELELTGRGRNFQLVLYAWNRPDIKELEFFKKMRLDSRLADLPVVLLTGIIDPQNLALALTCGITAVVARPFTLELLTQKIAEAVQASRQHKRRA